MTYKKIYQHCQGFTTPVRRNLVRDELLKITGVRRLMVVKTGLDVSTCRGFYLSARNTDHPFVKQVGGHVVVLARDQEPAWDRLVFVKEALHLLDDPIEATDSGDELEAQLNELTGPGNPIRSPQMKAELQCYWMALSLLCPETRRQEFIKQREAGEITDYDVALGLRIPEKAAQRLFLPNFLELINKIMDNHEAANGTKK